MKAILVVLLAAAPYFTQLKYDRTIDWNLPDPVKKRLDAAHFWDAYSLSDRVNPFYLRGDFDGDGKPDYAVLVTSKKSNKSAIVVCLSSRNSLDVLGAEGTKLRVGSLKAGYELTEFDWMDAWQVHSRLKLGQNELNPPGTFAQMAGEGLMVEKTESASALIYWDGSRFRWYQLGD